MSRRPLGYAITGGVLLSTALTLFLVPVVYSLVDRVWVRRPRAAVQPAVSAPGVAGPAAHARGGADLG